MTTTNRLNVSDINFNDIKSNLKEYLKSQDTLQDYDFEGSALSTIIDMLAYVTHYNAVNANIGVNETFLDTAQSRGSVVGHARQLGYTPRSATAPIAYINLTVNNPTSPILTLERGHRFKTKIGNSSYTFLTDQEYTTINGVFQNVKLVQGTIQRSEFIYDSISNEKLLIPHTNADISTIRVFVYDSETSPVFTSFIRAQDLTTINNDSPVYFIDENPDGLYELSFGDNVVGQALENGNYVVAEYLVTDKTEANGSSVFTNVDSVDGNTNVTITTVQSALGGSEKEDTEAIRRVAPITFAAQNRAVTPGDFEALVRTNFSNVESIKVWGGETNDPPIYGKVFLAIKPRDGEILSDREKEVILDEIVSPKSVVTITPEILDPDFTYITMNVFFKYNPSLTTLTEAQLENAVTDSIRSYNDNTLTRFDQVFRYSNLLSIVDSTDSAILNSFARVYVSKKFRPILNTQGTYTLDYSVDLYKSSETRPVIKSSSQFTIGDKEGCYFSDAPGPGTGGKGYRKVQILRGSGAEVETVIKDAGYIEGSQIVLVNFNPSKFENGAIQIEVTPNSYDIFAKENSILSIESDTTKFFVSGEVDTIAAGSEFSGTNYTTTPKHR